MAISRLKRRPDYLRVAGSGLKAVFPGLVLQASSRPDCGEIRVGFTASRRVGGAIARNRAKRRLRAVAEQVMPGHAKTRYDYVLIARQTTPYRPYQALVGDLRGALKKLKLYESPATAEAPKTAV